MPGVFPVALTRVGMSACQGVESALGKTVSFCEVGFPQAGSVVRRPASVRNCSTAGTRHRRGCT